MSSPRGERTIIALVGKRNVGKSSLINALVGQKIAIVSDVPGTTTDPVDKHYELVPIGPVTFFDTAGIDDIGELGEMRIASTQKILYRADVVLFINEGSPFLDIEKEMIAKIQEMKIPMLMVFNKSDLQALDPDNLAFCEAQELKYQIVSAKNAEGMDALKEKLIASIPAKATDDKVIVGDILKPQARVLLVAPIDAAAPKGRLILPQVQTIRDILDHNAICSVVKDTELAAALQMYREPPDLVITDSQAIGMVAEITPPEIAITTFSILFARYKGELDILISGISAIDKLKDGDRILIAEACSHHAQEDDIGRAKIPRWISEFLQKDLIFDVYAGHDFPEDLEKYALCIHCGGCMINAMEMNRRILECYRRGVPITNYGIAITKIHGAYERCIAPLLKGKA